MVFGKYEDGRAPCSAVIPPNPNATRGAGVLLGTTVSTVFCPGVGVLRGPISRSVEGFARIPAQRACPRCLQNAGRAVLFGGARPHSVLIYQDATYEDGA